MHTSTQLSTVQPPVKPRRLRLQQPIVHKRPQAPPRTPPPSPVSPVPSYTPDALVAEWHTPRNQQTMRALLVTTWQRTTQLPRDAAAHAVDHELGVDATLRAHDGHVYVWGGVLGGFYRADVAYARVRHVLPEHATPLSRLQTLVMCPQPQASAVPLPHPPLTNELLLTVARSLPVTTTLDVFNARVAALPQLAPPDVYVRVGMLGGTPTPRTKTTHEPSTTWLNELHARADVQMTRLNQHWQRKLDDAVATMRDEQRTARARAWRVAGVCALGVGMFGWRLGGTKMGA